MNNATHKASDGTLYREAGQWWLVWRHNAWWVISGEPLEKLERIS